MNYSEFKNKYGLNNFVASDIYMSWKLHCHNRPQAPKLSLEAWLELEDTKLLIEDITNVKTQNK
jgi:hypothetical protein